MQRITLVSAFAIMTAVAGIALAQQQPPPPAQQPPAPEPQAPSADVSDTDLDTFATIYVELQKTAAEYSERIQDAESPEESQELQSQMRDDSVQTVEEQGWSVEMYNMVAQAINADPALAEKAMALIGEKS
jgi:hypothetical protein